MDKVTAFVGLGSNLGDRSRTLTSAVALMGELDGVLVRRVSPLVETAPVGGPASQAMYLNGVAEIETTLAPMALLEALQGVEKALGRARPGERLGPRTCDLDIVLMGDVVMDSDRLTIPHPRMHQRRFVLEPLAQLAPEATHPTLGRTAGELLAQLDRQS